MFDFLWKLFGSCCCIKSQSQESYDDIGGKTYPNRGASTPVVTTTHDYRELRIGAFNIKRFGTKKFNDDFAINYILQIIARYDFLLIQEVQDSKHKQIDSFMKKLNSFTKKAYTHVMSDNLGRKSYKEQYVYIFRSDLFEIVDTYHYDDGPEEEGTDTFEREPFIALVKTKKSPVETFAVIGVHIRPSAVEEELIELCKVHDEVQNRWKSVPVILMGDFNAGRSYLSKTKMASLELRTNDKYNWLIENEDTTVSDNSYTHDRIIVTGNTLLKHVKKQSPKAFKFDEEFSLSQEDALRISDHYPVEFVIGKSMEKTDL